MKKLLIIFFILATAYFVGSLYEIHQNIKYLERVLYLMDEGYSKKASEHIAKVEFKLIPEDAEYIALMED